MHTRRSARTGPVLAGMVLAAALAVTGCGAADGGSASSADKAAAPGAGNARPGAADSVASGAGGAKSTHPSKATGTSVPAGSHIIRTASLTLQVKDVPKALDSARTAAVDAGGYVGDETTTRDGGGRERTRAVLRVPTDRYDAVLSSLEGTGKVVERTAKAEDVTDQVVDVESRVKSQRVSVARVRELMDQATKLSDVVALEGELSTRESDLDALLAQQASLKDRTSLATITLSLSETPLKQAAKKSGTPGFVDALTGGWDAFVTMLRWIAVVFGVVLPFLLSAGLLLALWLRLARTGQPRRPGAAAAPAGAGSLPVAPPVREEGGDED
ncbi:DUF4349 domain-containing protein [Streptomyces mirabilis]|uniref:DUF4349 domain-containing protein n=1 Tax=Streptomyces mirabilis TaxID=68239 RepID=UPI002252B6B7|nr:DUF4349 domain-containing protein [Streptomyces mirabilis]MCX4420755.1 DUF4349 domain-containing protein [Streptomyces mirabilis]